MLAAQGLQDAGVCRRAALGAADDRQLQFVEQQRRHLLGAGGVEIGAGVAADLGLDLRQVGLEVFLGLAEDGAVDGDAGVLHAGQAEFQGNFLVTVDRQEALFRQFGFQQLGQAPGALGVLAGVAGHGGDGHLIHGLAGLQVDDGGGRDLRLAQQGMGQVIQAVAFAGWVQEPRGKHGIAVVTGHRQPMGGQDAGVEFGMLADFAHRGIRQQGREQGLGRGPVDGGTIGTQHRQVGGGTFHRATAGEGDAHQAVPQGIQTGGFRIDGEASRGPQIGDEGRQVRHGQGAVGFRRGGLARDEGRRGGGGGARRPLEPGQGEAEARVHRAVEGPRPVAYEGHRIRQVRNVRQGDEVLGVGGLGDEGADVLRLLALQFVDVRQHGFEGAVLGQQFGGGLGTHAGDAWHVVGRVADHAQVVHHLVGPDALFGLQFRRATGDALTRVPGGDVGGQDLVDVLVLGQQAHGEALGLGPLGEGRQDVVGLVAGNLQHRHVAGGQQGQHVGDLGLQQIRHGIAVGLVIRFDLMAETVADVEHRQPVGDGRIRLEILHQVGEGVRDARRPPTRPGERGHAEVHPVQVIMPVNEGDGGLGHAEGEKADAARTRTDQGASA